MILVPRSRDPFGPHQGSRPRAGDDFLKAGFHWRRNRSRSHSRSLSRKRFRPSENRKS